MAAERSSDPDIGLIVRSNPPACRRPPVDPAVRHASKLPRARVGLKVSRRDGSWWWVVVMSSDIKPANKQVWILQRSPCSPDLTRQNWTARGHLKMADQVSNG
jgi:hypothetical protein